MRRFEQGIWIERILDLNNDLFNGIAVPDASAPIDMLPDEDNFCDDRRQPALNSILVDRFQLHRCQMADNASLWGLVISDLLQIPANTVRAVRM